MPDVYIMIGTPGSGKSTMARTLWEMKVEDAPEVLGADAIREELFGKAEIQGGQEVFMELFKRIRTAIKDERSVIVDNTSIKARDRKALINLFNDSYKIHYVVMLTPLAECLRRNKARDRFVPEDVICKKFSQLRSSLSSLPSETDSIYYIIDGEVKTQLPEGFKYE